MSKKNTRPTLEDLCPNHITDINTIHHYLPTYESLYSPIRDEPLTILIIDAGMSGVVEMMNNYFTNAIIHVCDGREGHHFKPPLYHSGLHPNVVLHSSAGVFDPEYIESEFVNNGLVFDIIVEDTSPRTLDIMSSALKLYSPLLAPNGILILEDVQDIDWVNILTQYVPEGRLRENITVYDLTASGRYDDILFVVKN
jgi:hypothetical protein